MRLRILTGALVISAALTSGCASMTKAEIDKNQLKKVQSVAIVGFHISMQEPKSLIGDIKKLKQLGNGELRDANEQHDTSDDVYAILSKRLSQSMKWQMKTPAQIASSSRYKEFLNQYTKGLQVGPMTAGENYHKMRPHGLLDADPFIYKISQEARDNLMTELGVDAVVVDFLIASLKDESWFSGMVGAAEYKPKTQNVIRVFIKGKKDPVWLDSWAWGEGDKALQASLNYVEDKLLLEQVVIASRKSIGETLNRYNSH